MKNPHELAENLGSDSESDSEDENLGNKELIELELLKNQEA
jgi:hypothetical protein